MPAMGRREEENFREDYPESGPVRNWMPDKQTHPAWSHPFLPLKNKARNVTFRALLLPVAKDAVIRRCTAGQTGPASDC